ncbi:MAG: hypothetical protein BWY52_00695 [Chloroflexi bacterium ADurb.Bin325]|nr:MAG: hypothetical protein BWY52_00695 [Chloroflexi bacterium ADurb.Bin325]
MLAALVCAESGAQPSEACPSRRDELFAANQGPLPAGYDLWQRVRVDRITGQLATEFTPEERVETRDVMVFPQRYRAWAEAHGYPVLGQQRPPLAFEPELALYGPEDGATVMGLTPVIGHVRVPEPLVWRLEYGVGPDPIGWGVLSGPNPPDPADPVGRDLDGVLGDWDVEATVAQHDTTDFSLRLAAYYDAGALDYPIAISNIVYIRIASPTATPTPTETAMPTDTPWPTPTIEPTPSATPDLGPTPPAEPSPSPTPGAAASIRAAILTPEEGATVDGPVEILGVADGPGFITYLVEFAPGAAPAAGDWQPVAEPSTQAVSGGLLATWDTTGLPPGVYTLRVQVFDVAGSSVADDVRVNMAGG